MSMQYPVLTPMLCLLPSGQAHLHTLRLLRESFADMQENEEVAYNSQRRQEQKVEDLASKLEALQADMAARVRHPTSTLHSPQHPVHHVANYAGYGGFYIPKQDMSGMSFESSGTFTCGDVVRGRHLVDWR